MYVCMCVCVYVRMCMCVYVNVHVHLYMYVLVSAFVYLYVYVYVRRCLCLCAFACAYACVCVWVKGRSTATAIYCLRRIQEFAERGHSKLSMVFLDWEKAFDKVYHDKMFLALERMGIPTKLIQIVKALYKKLKFKVKTAGNTSGWKTIWIKAK